MKCKLKSHALLFHLQQFQFYYNFYNQVSQSFSLQYQLWRSYKDVLSDTLKTKSRFGIQQEKEDHSYIITSIGMYQ